MSEMENSLLKEFIQRQEDFNKAHSENTQKILRGLYGEEENGTIGLVDRMQNAEVKLKKHDNMHKKIGFGALGFLIAVEIAWKGLKTWIESK